MHYFKEMLAELFFFNVIKKILAEKLRQIQIYIFHNKFKKVSPQITSHTVKNSFKMCLSCFCSLLVFPKCQVEKINQVEVR